MAILNDNDTSKALFKNTGIIAIGQASTKVVNFLLLPLYTAILSTTEYGLVDVLSTYSSFIVIIISLQITQAAFRFLVTCRNDENEKKKIITTICVAILCSLSVYIMLFFLVQPFIVIPYKWFLLFHVGSTLFLQLSSSIARGVGRNADYAVGNFLSAAIAIVLNVVTVAVMKLGVSAMLMSYIIGHIIGSLYMIRRCKVLNYFNLSYASFEKFNTIIHYSLPLIPNEISWSVIHASDRVIVQQFLSLAANGLIAVASKFSVIYTTFFSIFNTSWTEQVVLHYYDIGGKIYISKMFNKMVTFFGTIAIGIIACMPFFFKLLVNQKFSDSYGLIPLYLIAVFFNAIIGLLSAIYLINNETKVVAISTMVAAIVNLVSNLVLVQIIGVYAAPLSSICGYVTISLWRFIDINQRHCIIKFELTNLLCLLFMLFFTLTTYYYNNFFLQLLNLIVIVLFALYLNMELFKELRVLLIKKRS